jgi:hypothetical protein
MLTLLDSRFPRRQFLTAGSLALGGLSLPQLIAARETTRQAGLPTRDVSVVFLFMQGGPSQTETFDPKMTAPAEYRSATGEISTAIPGVTFGATFERLATLANKFSVVRSFATGDGNHDIKPIVGKASSGAALGSIYSRVVGSTHFQTGLPTNVTLFPQAVDSGAKESLAQFGRFDSTGPFGQAYAPFIPGAGGVFQEDLELQTTPDRLTDRRQLLKNLEQLQRQLDTSGSFDGMAAVRSQALKVLVSGVSEAFDLSKEDPRTVERYDTSKLIRPESIDKRWNNHQMYRDHSQTLGKLMLMARRLCERGAGFVTVNTNFVWDMHADQNNATVTEGMQYCGRPFDHAVSAFIEDVEARGLRNNILLVACGEMGRTPKINERGGRDHWGQLAPLLLYGGGLKMGQVVGRSDAQAGSPASTPYNISNLLGTILQAQFDLGQLRLVRGLPNEIVRMTENFLPIPELVG